MRIRTARKTFKLKTEKRSADLLSGDFTSARIGYRMSGGKLKSAYRFAALEPVSKAYSAAFVDYVPEIGYTVCVTSRGQIYKWNLTDKRNFAYSGLVTSFHQPYFFSAFANGVATRYVCGLERMIALTAEGYKQNVVTQKTLGGCYHCGRVFAADAEDGYILRWSSENVLDWEISLEKGGYVRLAPAGGKILGLFELGDGIVALREYALTVIKALGTPQHFSVRYEDAARHDLMDTAHTAFISGGKLHFFSNSRLYTFDGQTLTEGQVPWREELSGFERLKIYDGRTVYVHCVNAGDGGAYLLEWDTLTNEYALMCKDAQAFWRTPDGYFILKNNEVYGESESGAENACSWTTRPIDFGTDAVKTLKEVTVNRTDGVGVWVSCDGVKRELAGNGRITVDMAGREFLFGAEGFGELSTFKADWEVRA